MLLTLERCIGRKENQGCSHLCFSTNKWFGPTVIPHIFGRMAFMSSASQALVKFKLKFISVFVSCVSFRRNFLRLTASATAVSGVSLGINVDSAGSSPVDDSEYNMKTFASGSAGAEGSTAISATSPIPVSNLTELGVRPSPLVQGSIQTPPMRQCFLLHQSFKFQNSS